MTRMATVAIVLFLALISCRGEQPAPDPTPAGPEFTVEVVYAGLDLPTSLEFAPDGKLLILERGFSRETVDYGPALKVFDVARQQLQLRRGTMPATSHFNEVSGNQGGAVGMALGPLFSTNHRLYVCYHYTSGTGALENRLSSFEVKEGALENERVIVDRLPGDDTHNGCRVAIDRDGLLYLTTGSIEPFDDAMDLARLSGKVLRVTPAGDVPPGNPFPRSPIWSYGHRNAQGLAFDPETGVLWSTEHGEESADELNRIEPGANYGFPRCRGAARIGERFMAEDYWADRLEIEAGQATCLLAEPHASRYRPAFRTYYPDSTVGISDMTVYNGAAFPGWRGSLLITMLKAQRLVRVIVKDGEFVEETTLLERRFGRLRDVTVGPDGFVYVLTNEPGPREDWRGHSRLLRLRPAASRIRRLPGQGVA